jgi:hypothetical protein
MSRPHSRPPRRRHQPTQPRTLHLVDIDNLTGDPTCTDPRLLRRIVDTYRVLAGYTPGDHVVMATGCNGRHVLEAELAWPGVLHRRRKGPDGADLELIDSFDTAIATSRYTRVVIGSGDQTFTRIASDTIRAGLHLTVVSRRNSLAGDLRKVAGLRVRYLPPIVAG